MKNIFYWSPCLSNIGTINSTLNSAIGLKKYFKEDYNVVIINVCGEWDKYRVYLKKNNIEIQDLGFNYFKFLPKEGYIFSRISYLIIFILSFLPLRRLLLKNKPDHLILHLITSLPLFIMLTNKVDTNFILRISGFPKLNFIRKLFWKKISNKIKYITFPSYGSLEDMKLQKIFDEKKMIFLQDPFINVSKFNEIFKNKEKVENNFFIDKKYFIAVGRLTKQKNFKYLIKEFSKFCKINNNYVLLIFGEGEEKNLLNQFIIKNKLQNYIYLMGYQKNVMIYMKKAEAFILSSLWEDPGSVLMESAYSNLYIISSDCKNGPKEFLSNGNAGLLFKSNKENKLYESLNLFLNKENLFKQKVLAKKNSKIYTMFQHSIKLNKILNY